PARRGGGGGGEGGSAGGRRGGHLVQPRDDLRIGGRIGRCLRSSEPPAEAIRSGDPAVVRSVSCPRPRGPLPETSSAAGPSSPSGLRADLADGRGAAGGAVRHARIRAVGCAPRGVLG